MRRLRPQNFRILFYLLLLALPFVPPYLVRPLWTLAILDGAFCAALVVRYCWRRFRPGEREGILAAIGKRSVLGLAGGATFGFLACTPMLIAKGPHSGSDVATALMVLPLMVSFFMAWAAVVGVTTATGVGIMARLEKKGGPLALALFVVTGLVLLAVLTRLLTPLFYGVGIRFKY